MQDEGTIAEGPACFYSPWSEEIHAEVLFLFPTGTGLLRNKKGIACICFAWRGYVHSVAVLFLARASRNVFDAPWRQPTYCR